MGMEDFGVLLKPGSERVSVQEIAQTLKKYNFLQPEKDNEGLSSAPFQETVYILQERHSHTKQASIVEALVKWQSGNSVDPDMHSIHLRFAICQSSAAAKLLFSKVQKLACRFHLVIFHDGKSYAAEQFEAFRVDAEQKIALQKTRWHAMFGEADEEIALPVAQVWEYFLRKQPQLLAANKPLP